MKLLRKLWDAVPVRASRYSSTLNRARTAELDVEYLKRDNANALSKNAELDATNREAQGAARLAEASMTAMQRSHAKMLREQYQRFGGEPTVRVVPKDTRSWTYFVPQGMPEIRFFEPGAVPTADTCRVATKTVDMKHIGVTLAIGLPTEVPPEAIAMRVGQEMTDAVLRAFREQSELMKN